MNDKQKDSTRQYWQIFLTERLQTTYSGFSPPRLGPYGNKTEDGQKEAQKKKEKEEKEKEDSRKKKKKQREQTNIAELMEKEPVRIYTNKYEAEGVKKVTGVSDVDLVKVESGDHLKIGENDIEFLHTPGHTPGSQCFKVNNNLISGDTLFIQGCGRVDLPGSDSEQMYNSLKHLSSLPDETILYPGHHYSEEECSTLGEVKEKNVHMRITDLDTWKQLMG